MSILNHTWLAVLVLGGVGCAVPLPGMHGTMHPSVDGESSGAGVAVGAFDAQTDVGDDSSNVFLIPYGEGWARFTAGPGQFELRIGLPFTTAAYRWNIIDGADGVGFSLVPGLGLAYTRQETTTVDAMGMEENEVDATIVFAPELALLITFVQNQLYLSPRIGLVHSATVAGADPMDDDTTSDFLSYGGAIGWNFAGTDPFWYSLELSIFAVDDMEDGPGDSGTTVYFIPTFGIHTG
jgi:hypothetical protein